MNLLIADLYKYISLVIAEGGLHVPIMPIGGNSHRSSPVNLAQFFGRDIMSQVRINFEGDAHMYKWRGCNGKGCFEKMR